jgi:hypothetical protein
VDDMEGKRSVLGLTSIIFIIIINALIDLEKLEELKSFTLMENVDLAMEIEDWMNLNYVNPKNSC